MSRIWRAPWRAIERASCRFIGWLVRNRQIDFVMNPPQGGPLPSQRVWRQNLVRGLVSLKWVPVLSRHWRAGMLRIAHSLRAMAQTHARSDEELLAVLTDRAASEASIFEALDILHRKGVRVEPNALRALVSDGRSPILAACLLWRLGEPDDERLIRQLLERTGDPIEKFSLERILASPRETKRCGA